MSDHANCLEHTSQVAGYRLCIDQTGTEWIKNSDEVSESRENIVGHSHSITVFYEHVPDNIYQSPELYPTCSRSVSLRLSRIASTSPQESLNTVDGFFTS